MELTQAQKDKIDSAMEDFFEADWRLTPAVDGCEILDGEDNVLYSPVSSPHNVEAIGVGMAALVGKALWVKVRTLQVVGEDVPDWALALADMFEREVFEAIVDKEVGV